MNVRRFAGSIGGVASLVESPPVGPMSFESHAHDLRVAEHDWTWIDIELTRGSSPAGLDAEIGELGLDPLAVSDAFAEADLPKLDEFDDHVLLVLHGLSEGRASSAEHDGDSDDETFSFAIHCFVTPAVLVTIRSQRSNSIDAFARQLLRSRELSAGGPSEILARIADVISRRYLRVLDDLDDRVEQLTEMALDTNPDFLEHLTIAREHVGELRHILRPQREAFDQIRRTTSSVVTDNGRRRFSDVFDTARRCVQELETARTGLSDTLGAYQGAEAREATEVTKLLTIYAAVLLPLSLIAGVFGMNFKQIPGDQNPWGFYIVVGLMLALTLISLGLFAATGWIRLAIPGGLRRTLHKGTVRRITAPPVELADAIFQRTTATMKRRSPKNRSS